MAEHSKIASTFRAMNLVYLVQMGIMMIFCLVALYVRNTLPIDNELAKMLRYLLVGLFIGGLIGAQSVPQILVKRIDKKLELKSKLSKYFWIVLVRSAFLEVPGLFAGVATLLTGRSYFIVIIAPILIAFYYYLPSTRRIAEDLNLDSIERIQLDEIR